VRGISGGAERGRVSILEKLSLEARLAWTLCGVFFLSGKNRPLQSATDVTALLVLRTSSASPIRLSANQPPMSLAVRGSITHVSAMRGCRCGAVAAERSSVEGGVGDDWTGQARAGWVRLTSWETCLAGPRRVHSQRKTQNVIDATIPL
jgi:hypothetical protein